MPDLMPLPGNHGWNRPLKPVAHLLEASPRIARDHIGQFSYRIFDFIIDFLGCFAEARVGRERRWNVLLQRDHVRLDAARKGQVKRRLTQAGIVWQARLSQTEAGSSMLANLLGAVFEGSAQKLVLHLLERGQLTENDQRQIRELLASNRRQPNA